MPGLLDLVPSVESVTLCNQKIPVSGVTLAGIALLIARFPELRDLLSGKSLDANALIARVPDAVAAIIAAGIGFAGDEKQEAVAAALPMGAQVDLIEAIIRATLPGGAGPFVAKLQAFMALGAPAPPSAGSAIVPNTNSAKPSGN